MSNAVAIRPSHAVSISDPKTIATFRRTHCPQATDDEFNMFIAYCSVKRLDPIKGDAILVIYGKEKYRQAKIITTQSGSRSLADRAGGYHPAKPGDTVWTFTLYHRKRKKFLDDAAEIFNIQERTKRLQEINENMPIDRSNPFGLVEARTVVYKNGIPAEGIAKWVEFAPLTPDPACFDLESTGEYWPGRNGGQGNEKKRKVLKPGINPLEHLILETSGKWGNAGELMLAKCATVNALKAAFPDTYDNDFQTEETMDKTIAEARTASELAEIGETERRLEAIGKKSPETYVWADNNGDITHYPPGTFGDAVLRTVRECKFRDDYDRLMARPPNKETFNLFWAMHRADALDVKVEFEAIRDRLPPRPAPITIEHEGVPTNA